jgi:hypothetical protein
LKGDWGTRFLRSFCSDLARRQGTAGLVAPKPAKTSNRFDPAILNLVNQELGRVLRKYPTHNITGGVAIAGLDEQPGLRTRGTKLWNYVKELRQMPDTHAYRCY